MIMADELAVVPAGSPVRVLFVNENIGGHVTVHAALRRAMAGREDLHAQFLDVPDPGLVGKLLRRPLPLLGPLDLDLQPLRAQLVRSNWTRRALARHLASGKIDAVHVYTHNVALLSARQLRTVPTVITTDSTTALNAYRLPYRDATRFTPATVALSQRLERPVLQAARRVVANANFVADSLLGAYAVPAERLRVLPFGVAIPPRPAERPERRPTVVFVGHQLERKGGRRLIKLHQEHLLEHCDLLLVTTEPVEPLPGVRVVSDLKAGSDALWELLAGADIMCFPSTIDQAPNAVLEGAAAGLPVIAYPVAAVSKMVVDGVTGLLVAPGDDVALLAALRRLLSDGPLRRSMGRRAREHVEQNYDMQVAADQLAGIVLEAVAEHRAEVSK